MESPTPKDQDDKENQESHKGKLKQYPSGFLGSAGAKQTKKEDLEDMRALTQKMFNRSSKSKSIDHSSNIEVNLIWSKVLENSKEVSSFEFKQKVLKVAIEAFGASTLIQWIDAQNSNSEYGEYQQRFIDETINFIYYGKRRNLTFDNWVSLLRSDNIDVKSVDKYSEVQEIFFAGFNLNRPNELNKYKTIVELIHDWICRKNGINDLTSSLYVLFGAR